MLRKHLIRIPKSNLKLFQFFSSSSLSSSNLSPPATFPWTTNQVRETFVQYFLQQQKHQYIPSSSVVPFQDESLLFTNAGMNQFKSIFLGTVDPKSTFSSLKRVVNHQKCIRAGGKHNDLADVGKDTYHHTFFEMLGTWSFGDYFKVEAIEWAFELLVQKYGLDKERIYVSYFAGDESLGIPCDVEARDIWLKLLPPQRVLPFGSKENFWEMGETGPCGPCSEIHYDLIGGRDAALLVNQDDPTVLEIWNLVFIQFHRELVSGNESSSSSPKSILKPLPSKHVDTGMGLERIASILQKKTSNYDIDIFEPIFDHIYQHTKGTGTPPYGGKLGLEDEKSGFKDMAYRAIADHVRALCIAISDGAIPSNEKRGYVLRRILRRAFRHGLVLNTPPEYLASLVPTVIRTLSSSYPELLEKEAYIQAIINEEEKAFAALLPRGLKYLNELLTAEEQKNSDSKQISGRHAFYLYDTLGFPIDLTQLILEEKGYVVDMNAFEELMQEQKRTSKEKSPAKRTNNESHFSTVSIGIDQIAALQSANIPPTNDEWKYISGDPVSSPLSLTPKIQAIVTPSGELVLSPSALPLENELIHCGIILDQTSFFSESGGQISDIGTLQIPLSSDGKSLTLHVIDVQVCGPYVIHTCTQSSLPTHLSGTSSSIDLDPTAPVKCDVDYSRRLAISSNHTMTHILNYALRRVLSPNSTLAIDQKGSLVTEEKLRFDFSYSKPLLKNEVEEIESIINNLIRDRLEVNTNYTSLSNISDINGLRAVFGETYPDPVRVVSIGSTIEDILSNPSRTEWLNFSIELCGGNHLKNTSEAILFRIIEEISSARGVRRISAVTGDKALQVQSESQKLKQMIANEQKCLTSSPLTASELSKSSVKLLKFHDLLTSQTIPYTDRIVITSLFNDTKKLLTTMIKQHISDDIDKHLLKLVQQGEMSLKQNRHFDIFILTPDKLMPSKDFLGTMAQEKKEGQQQQQQEEGQQELYQLSDSIHYKKLVNGLNQKFNSQLSYLLIIQDQQKNKITCVSSVQPQAIEKGVTANEWIECLMKRFDGKGGGRNNLANGSLNYDNEVNPLQLDEVISNAQELLEQYELKMKQEGEE